MNTRDTSLLWPYFFAVLVIGGPAAFPELLPASCVVAASFVLGTWYGLYLNLTHMHRMRRWACKLSDFLNGERGCAVASEERSGGARRRVLAEQDIEPMGVN